MAILKELGKGVGGLASGGSWLNRAVMGGNPADKAMPYLNQAEDLASNAYNPYIQRGEQAYGNLQPQYESMSQDPTAYLNDLMSNYRPSTGYQFAEKEMSRALANDAAAAGFSGSDYHQKQRGELIRGLLGQDMQNFLRNVLGIQSTGMQGQQGIADTGFNAASQRTDALGNVYGAKAGLGFQGQQQKNQQKAELVSALIQMLGAGLGA